MFFEWETLQLYVTHKRGELSPSFNLPFFQFIALQDSPFLALFSRYRKALSAAFSLALPAPFLGPLLLPD